MLLVGGFVLLGGRFLGAGIVVLALLAFCSWLRGCSSSEVESSSSRMVVADILGHSIEASMSRTTRAKPAGRRSRCRSEPTSFAALSLKKERQRSSTLPALFGGGFSAGQRLAHHQRDRFFDRCVGAAVDRRKFALAYLSDSIDRGFVAVPAMAARADRLDARLLDGVEDRARLWPSGASWVWILLVMAGAAQRHRIAEAARNGDFLRGWLLGKFWRRFRQSSPKHALVELGHHARSSSSHLLRKVSRKAKPTSPKISAFSAQVMTVRGLITVDRSPLMKAARSDRRRGPSC
jgi:hypothetical protein